MNSSYHYVILRLAPDDLRGEVINVGAVIFHNNEAPRVVMMAVLNKLRAVDSTWGALRLARWASNIQSLAAAPGLASEVIRSLGRFRFCDPDAVGMFTAESEAEVVRNIAEIKSTYVANKATADRPKREKRTRLQTALRDQFRNMQVLGETIDDIAGHLVVQNVPVPEYPELKSDFVYKNGVYRVTQTFDYRVAPDSIHNKLSEACVKSMAAELAMKSYGSNTIRLAVLDVPDEYLDAASSHTELLKARGFQMFNYLDSQNMAKYLDLGAPQIYQALPLR